MSHIPQISVIGGTSFVGRYVVPLLAKQGWRVRVIARNPEGALYLKTGGNVGQISIVQGNITKPDGFAGHFQHDDAVLNLVGILSESGAQKFQTIHADAPEHIARMAQAAGVKRFIHLSALGCDAPNPSRYAASKFRGEQQILNAFPEATILRPSIIFGPEDDFFNRFAYMASLSPVLPLVGGGKTRFQPVYVGDIAQAIVTCLGDPDTSGATYELGGPEIYSFKQLLEYIMLVTGKSRPFAPLPISLAKTIAPFTKPFGAFGFTADQMHSLKHDNIVDANAKQFAHLHIDPAAMESIVPEFLSRYSKSSSKV